MRQRLSLHHDIDRLKAAIEKLAPPALTFPSDPVAFAEKAFGFQLDGWQQQVMRSTADRLCCLCARQAGKSVSVAAKAAFEALTHPGLRVVVVAPSFRQAALLGEKIGNALSAYDGVRHRVRDRIETTSGSSIAILHGDRPDTLRGFTADLLLMDELGFVRENLLPAVLPMLASTQGKLFALSTPHGPSGPLYDLWQADDVEKIRVRAEEVSHFDPEYIADIRKRLGPALARQELDAEFVVSRMSVFSADLIDAMFGGTPEASESDDWGAFADEEAELKQATYLDSLRQPRDDRLAIGR